VWVNQRSAAPICNLSQRLVVVPRSVHGNQRLLSHCLEVSQARLRKRIRADPFGNVVFGISIAKVEAVDVDVSLIVERLTGQGPHLEAATRQALNVYLLPSALTRPDAALRAAVAELACSARRAPSWLASSAAGCIGGMSMALTGPACTPRQARRPPRDTVSARTMRM
jgi:Bacterial transglutaminase-like N-terminal region